MGTEVTRLPPAPSRTPVRGRQTCSYTWKLRFLLQTDTLGSVLDKSLLGLLSVSLCSEMLCSKVSDKWLLEELPRPLSLEGAPLGHQPMVPLITSLTTAGPVPTL